MSTKNSTAKPLPRHPIADLFPRMDAHQYVGFKASIEKEGQKTDCLTWQGKLCDGVHRERACLELGITPRYTEFEGDEEDMIRHVSTLNVARRHMSAGQLAYVGVEIEKEIARVLAEKKKTGGAKGGKAKKGGKHKEHVPYASPDTPEAAPDDAAPDAPAKPSRKKKGADALMTAPETPAAPPEAAKPARKEPAPQARDLAGEAVGVSGRTIQNVKEVINKAPDLAEQIRDGTMTPSRAKTIVRRRERKADMERKAKTAAAAPDAGEWDIVTGDCVAGLKAIEAGTVRLLIADPPYNQGVDYGDGAKSDSLDEFEYLTAMANWANEVKRILTPDGSAWVLIADEYADQFSIMLRDAGLYRNQWIIWFESFGVNHPGGFNRCHRHLFWMVKDPDDFVFHPEAVTRPSDRQEKYGDKRAAEGGKTWDSVWGINPPIPRLTGTCAERIEGFPTQLPLALLKPIVLCASDPGDLVVDPFTGSGTTAVAAITHGRRFKGFERNPAYAETARVRVRASTATSSAA